MPGYCYVANKDTSDRKIRHIVMCKTSDRCCSRAPFRGVIMRQYTPRGKFLDSFFPKFGIRNTSDFSIRGNWVGSAVCRESV